MWESWTVKEQIDWLGPTTLSEGQTVDHCDYYFLPAEIWTEMWTFT